MEKEQGMTVSFLCDRETTQIAQSQPGFVNFILAPLFATVSQVVPELKQLELNAKDNAERWKNYEETDEFRAVYTRKTPEQRAAIKNAENAKANNVDEDEHCTVDPPQI